MAQNYSTAAVPASKYYIHTSYVPTYYYAYITLEKWLAANIFRNDLSRVFMASNNYAFRRRFELTDMSKAYDEIEASALRFPFANYNILNQGWVKDEREAANTAAQLYAGLYVGTTRLRSAAVTATIPVQLYFDREDDARLAYDKLFFFSFNTHYYKNTVPYGTNTLEIPYSFNLENLNFNPEFNEKDWLQQNRIFVITIDFKISTYAIYPPEQPDWDASDSDLSNYNDGIEQFYIVEDVILDFWTNDLKLDVRNYQGLEAFPYEGEPGVIYVDDLCPEESLGTDLNHKVRRCNIYIWKENPETGEFGYSQINTNRLVDIDLDSIGVNGSIASGTAQIKQLLMSNVTETQATLNWAYDTDYDPANISRITVAVNNPADEQDIDKASLSWTATGLKPLSNYIIYIKFYAVDGSVKRLYITFTTKATADELKKTLPKNALIGLNWDLD